MVCDGTMPSLLACRYGVLLLVLLLVFGVDPTAGVVCGHCSGWVAGCSGGDDCPCNTTVAKNVAALAATATTVLTLTHLLPLSVLRVFTAP
eukprot:562495-Prymnesium_polylepis.1